jgi:galactokinase
MMKLFVPGRLCLFGEHTDWLQFADGVYPSGQVNLLCC